MTAVNAMVGVVLVLAIGFSHCGTFLPIQSVSSFLGNGLADQIQAIAGAERVQQIGHGRV